MYLCCFKVVWYQIKAFVNIYIFPFLPIIETALTSPRIKFEENVFEYKLHQVKKYQVLKITMYTLIRLQ